MTDRDIAGLVEAVAERFSLTSDGEWEVGTPEVSQTVAALAPILAATGWMRPASRAAVMAWALDDALNLDADEDQMQDVADIVETWLRTIPPVAG